MTHDKPRLIDRAQRQAHRQGSGCHNHMHEPPSPPPPPPSSFPCEDNNGRSLLFYLQRYSNLASPTPPRPKYRCLACGCIYIFSPFHYFLSFITAQLQVGMAASTSTAAHEPDAPPRHTTPHHTRPHHSIPDHIMPRHATPGGEDRSLVYSSEASQPLLTVLREQFLGGPTRRIAHRIALFDPHGAITCIVSQLDVVSKCALVC